MTATLLVVIAVALAFDFTNGFHDAANAIATAVSTRSISPRLAVLFAGLLNFAGAFVSLKVASTIGKGIITPGAITLSMLLAGLLGAIAWNLTTWWLRLPSSSSHALVGGIAGAAIVGSGHLSVLHWSGIYHRMLVPSIVAPVLAFVVAALIVVPLVRARNQLDRRPRTARALQLGSAGFVAFTHGTNDAQKTMGVIALALVAGGQTAAFSVPTWVVVASATAMALGTYAGGWRIVRTLGLRLQVLDPLAGSSAQSAAALVLYATAAYGYPVSTTQTVTGSILGAGAANRFRSTHWSLGGRIALAWLVTLPAAALLGGALSIALRAPGAWLVPGLLIAAAAPVAVRALHRGLSGRDGEALLEG